jgi:hypothetical protein
MVASRPDCNTWIDFGRPNEMNFVTDGMSTRFSTTRRFATAWTTFVLASTTTMAARGGAYLPITGPTPLRFETATARTFASPLKSAGHDTKANDTKPVIEPIDQGTNASPQTSSAAGTDAAQAFPPMDPLGQSVTPEPMAAYSPPSDMPFITPQIVAEYFRPTATSTNAAGVSVFLPAPVGFMPPMEKPPASSRATYNVQ